VGLTISECRARERRVGLATFGGSLSTLEIYQLPHFLDANFGKFTVCQMKLAFTVLLNNDTHFRLSVTCQPTKQANHDNDGNENVTKQKI